MIPVDLHERIDAAVTEKLRGVAIEGVGKVASQMYPDITGLPDADMLLSVHLAGESEEAQQNHSADSESCWLPVLVSLCANWPDDGDIHARKYPLMRARATAMNAFRLQPGKMNSLNDGFALDNCLEVKRCRIDPEVIFDPNITAFKHVRTTFRLNFWCVSTQ